MPETKPRFAEELADVDKGAIDAENVPAVEVVVVGVGTPVATEDGARIFQILTDQSRLLVMKRSERSRGPRRGWKSTLMTGAAWPR